MMLRATIMDDLRAIQARHGYLLAQELRALAERTGTPLYHLQGVASFYPHFRLEPPPAVDVRVCTDLSCHLNGAEHLRRSVAERVASLGRADVTVRTVSCLGQCDRAPAASVNDVILTRLAPEPLYAAVEDALAGRPPAPRPDTGPAPALRLDPYAGGGRYGAVRTLLAGGDVGGVLAALREAGLRGMGGAGFPTATKWEIVRQAPGDVKYVVCNADESEPGTIKDRFLLEHAPHLVLEGMMVAALVTGARHGIVYIRHEYERQREILAAAIEACRAEGLLGPDVLGSGAAFDISIFVSPGGYICGEESALLEALEGKRAEPRNKPPFPGTHGLYNRPTVINNVETFADVPGILVNGVAWWKARGRSGSAGLKVVGVSGHVARPGVYEVPMGVPMREVIFDHAGGVRGGRPLKAFAPSGPSSGFLPPALLDVPVDFQALARAGSMLGSGAVVVCSDEACMLDLALNAVRFFKAESCGKCVPCRVGSAKMADLLAEVAAGRGRPADVDLIAELSDTLAATSICGLGQVVPNPIRSVLTHFREEFDDHLLRRRCPAGVCPIG
jgi:NADH:ubiquinone oxidoreductase subunit F (NADH-binding)/NADH:ubiquinone oxidoreductase subunit E